MSSAVNTVAKTATIDELHALFQHMTQLHEGKRLDPGVAAVLAVGLILDQRLEELRDAMWAVANQSPVNVEPPPAHDVPPATPSRRKKRR